MGINIENYEVFRKQTYKDFKTKNGSHFLLNEYPYLDIVTSDLCNANCKFCIGNLVDKKLVIDLDNLKEKVNYAIDTTGVKEVLIVGGEPTLSPDLFSIISFLKEKLNEGKINKICLTTNGHKMTKDKEFAVKLLTSGITHLNISLMSLDTEKQKEISQTKNSVTLNDLKFFYNVNGRPYIRINNNVFKGNNDNLKDILDFYNTVKPYCDSVKFSPLLKTDNFSVVDKVTDWVRDNILSDDDYDLLWHTIETYFSDYPIVRNKETFGFVEYSMVINEKPLILNYNQHGKLREKVIKERKINNVKLLSTGVLSLSWNRNDKDSIILE